MPLAATETMPATPATTPVTAQPRPRPDGGGVPGVEVDAGVVRGGHGDLLGLACAAGSGRGPTVEPATPRRATDSCEVYEWCAGGVSPRRPGSPSARAAAWPAASAAAGVERVVVAVGTEVLAGALGGRGDRRRVRAVVAVAVRPDRLPDRLRGAEQERHPGQGAVGGLDHRQGVEQVGEVGVVAGLQREPHALLEVAARAAACVAAGELDLGQVVERDVRRQPVPAAAGRRQAALDAPHGRVGVADAAARRSRARCARAPGPLGLGAAAGGEVQGRGEAARGLVQVAGRRARRDRSPATALAPMTGSSPACSSAAIHQSRAAARRRPWRRSWSRRRAAARARTSSGRSLAQHALGEPATVGVVAAQPPVHPQRPRQPGRRASGRPRPAAARRPR